MAVKKLVLFIDAQNLYNGARRAFFSASDPHYFGQTKPMELARLICSRPPPGEARSVHEVRVYTGRPDATREPRTYAAHMKQCHAWAKAGATVIPRTIRYPDDWPSARPMEKGIDVALAVDFVALAIDGTYDVGVIASSDTDLRPALEYVCLKTQCRVEVAAWTSPKTKSRLSIPGRSIWCYWLDRADYDAVADLTDYNVA